MWPDSVLLFCFCFVFSVSVLFLFCVLWFVFCLAECDFCHIKNMTFITCCRIASSVNLEHGSQIFSLLEELIMNVEYINNCRNRMVNCPDSLNLFDLGIDTLNQLNWSIDDLKPFRNDNRWRTYKRILEPSGLFDSGSIPTRAGALEFITDYFHIYHYDI